jgi:hypothetical protein
VTLSMPIWLKNNPKTAMMSDLIKTARKISDD